MKSAVKCKSALRTAGIIAFIVIMGFTTVSCTTTTNVKSNLAGEYNMIPKIAGKDFVVLALVSVETKMTYNVSPFKFSKITEGEKITFDLLMKEARARYPNASDIINIRIDTVNKSKSSIFSFFTGTTSIVEYYGNALAIQYTTAIPEGERPIDGVRGTIPGGEPTTSEGKKGLLGSIFGMFGG